MIKKLFSYIFLIFFTTNITAEEIVMKCKFKKYKYITQDLGNIILTTKKKGDPKWVVNGTEQQDTFSRGKNHCRR